MIPPERNLGGFYVNFWIEVRSIRNLSCIKYCFMNYFDHVIEVKKYIFDSVVNTLSSVKADLTIVVAIYYHSAHYFDWGYVLYVKQYK